jgi:hypothetical protein
MVVLAVVVSTGGAEEKQKARRAGQREKMRLKREKLSFDRILLGHSIQILWAESLSHKTLGLHLTMAKVHRLAVRTSRRSLH